MPSTAFFEAVLGAEVARQLNLHVGDRLASTHGDPEGAGHGDKFTVVGVLKPSGTPNDRAAFVNMEGFYLMEDHAKPLHNEEQVAHRPSPEHAHAERHESRAAHGVEPKEPLAIERREITAILVRTVSPRVTPRA